MPNVYVDCVRLWDEDAEKLIEVITTDLVDILKCDPEDVRVVFHEVPPSRYGLKGKLLTKFEEYAGPFEGGAYKPSALPLIFILTVDWYAGKSPQIQDKTAAHLARSVADAMKTDIENVEIGFGQLHHDRYYIGGNRVEAGAPQQKQYDSSGLSLTLSPGGKNQG